MIGEMVRAARPVRAVGMAAMTGVHNPRRWFPWSRWIGICATNRPTHGREDMMPDQSPRTIATINFKGGVGKTTVTWCLGDVLSSLSNERVLMFDLDAQTNGRSEDLHNRRVCWRGW